MLDKKPFKTLEEIMEQHRKRYKKRLKFEKDNNYKVITHECCGNCNLSEIQREGLDAGKRYCTKMPKGMDIVDDIFVCDKFEKIPNGGEDEKKA